MSFLYLYPQVIKGFFSEVYHPEEVIVGNLPIHYICVPLSLPRVYKNVICHYYISNILVTLKLNFVL